METQLIREQIIEILKKYEGIEVAYQFNVATEKEALTNKATSESIADEIINLVNQEVEKRIAERMPSDELLEEIQEKSLLEYENAPICEIDYYSGFEDGVKWLRSRLTKDENNAD